ncbi:hypothetical protein [Streptomyces sp. NPDC057702]|uniref:hypothetical protein n=1 Tax=unclassified Streptomyces TaxID=2593676 RepID=UPI00368B27A4
MTNPTLPRPSLPRPARSRPTRSRLGTLGGASLAAGVGALVLLAPTTAVADDGARPLAPATVSATDRTAAARTLASQDTTERVGAFFVRLAEREKAAQRDALDARVTREEAAAQAPRLVGPAVPVYSLSADFVRGTGATDRPVAEFAYLASEARSATGAAATVWTVRDAKTRQWTVANVISGTDEVGFGRKSAGDLVFTEPQIAAWYALDGDRVLPLNASARDAVGARGTSVAAYQTRVHDRYADKLPGSAYQRSGQFGGDGPRRAAPAADAPRATANEGSPAFGAAHATLAATGCVLLLGIGTAVVRVRRRTATG